MASAKYVIKVRFGTVPDQMFAQTDSWEDAHALRRAATAKKYHDAEIVDGRSFFAERKRRAEAERLRYAV